MSEAELVRKALDPHGSVAVEACAGSGKTWLLVSRILRLLLDGAAPGEILAITYTRKAAREIEERLVDWLRQLAVGSDEEVCDFLRQRAVPEECLEAVMDTARALYERVLSAQPPMTVSTFHGWFARLVQGAPLSSDLAGFVLHESGARMKEEVWQLFAAACGRRSDAASSSLLWLLEHVGLEATRRLLFRLSERRAEWHAYAGDGVEALPQALSRLRESLGVAESPIAMENLLADELFMRKLREYAGILLNSDLESDLQTANRLQTALAAPDIGVAFKLIAEALLTQSGTLRKRRIGKETEQRLGAVTAARLLDLHAWLGERVLAAHDARREEQVYELNEHAFTAGAAWLEALDQYKRERRLMDFADLEWHVSCMLADESHAAFLQARLDARYRHILLDEFQDTNPLQWQILLDWLAAYGEPDSVQPGVFVVGDPKQSIYRFRRADPRVFDCAADFLQRQHGAQKLANDTTRRNAPQVIEVVNRVFENEPLFPHFRTHRSASTSLHGRVELLPLCARAHAGPAASLLRDPLSCPQGVEEDGRRREEAALLAARIQEIVGSWAVFDKESGDERPARFGDILVLTRRRAVLPEFERALRSAAIPYLSVGRGGLLRTLEADDLTALLRCLVTTADDLALAHALRTPTLGVSDADLLHLAGRTEHCWWQRLQAMAQEGTASPALARAARLLAGWRVAASQLPVHDVLDRIYHEGELMVRYRAAVPAVLWPGVLANLEAYIALALRLDAGRYPSLPRFLDELRRMDEAGGEDAPDEGTIQATEAGDRVRILTIHGAKGLEAPIVWLIDAHNTHQPADAWAMLLDWPPQSARPSHLSMLGRKDECGLRRAALIEAEAAYAEREELNLLYVAMTRARQFFFASGVVLERNKAKTSYWERIQAALVCLGSGEGVHGEASMLASVPKVEAPPPAARVALAPAPAEGRRRDAASPGMDYGNRLHAALDWLSGGGGTNHPPPGVPSSGWPAIRAAALAILNAPQLKAFFDPSCHVRALNEAEFVLADGSAGRIDRLVEMADCYWILDYKSGRPTGELLEKYLAQLERYRAAVMAIFPGKPVHCRLVFGDGESQEII